MREGWEMKKLGEVCEFINGRAYSKPELLAEGKYKVLRVANFFRNNQWYYSNLELEENKYCDKGDLLYAWSASFGPRIWNGNKIIYHYHIWKVVADKQFITKEFLFKLLEWDTENIKLAYGTGTTMMHVGKGSIEKRLVPIPPLSEQQHIVSILDKTFAAIDEAKANTEKNLNNAKELFQSHVNKIFSEKGEGWMEKKLGEVAFVKSGGTPLRSKKEYWEGEIAWYSSGELNNLYTDNPERFINQLAINKSNAKIFPKGSLLIGMYDTAALKMSILDRDATFNQAIAGVKPNEKIDLTFILHSINSAKKELLKQRRGVRQKNLSLEKIKEIPIHFPVLEDQKNIVLQLDIFFSETKKLEALYQQKLVELEELKKSILEKAFKGELSEKEVAV